MKICFEFSAAENLSNIGIAKALTEVPNMTESDLYEIGRYLLVYSEARATEPDDLNRIQSELKKGGVIL